MIKVARELWCFGKSDFGNVLEVDAKKVMILLTMVQLPGVFILVKNRQKSKSSQQSQKRKIIFAHRKKTKNWTNGKIIKSVTLNQPLEECYMTYIQGRL